MIPRTAIGRGQQSGLAILVILFLITVVSLLVVGNGIVLNQLNQGLHRIDQRQKKKFAVPGKIGGDAPHKKTRPAGPS